MTEPVAIVGMAWTEFREEHAAALDELVFDVSSRALEDAALRKADIDLSLGASLDLYEARTISHGMSSPAAGGYLTDEYRLENDATASILSAAASILANDAEVAIVTSFNHPEVSIHHGQDPADFYRQISNLTFEPHFNRPVGITGDGVLAMHAARSVEERDLDGGWLADVAATEINRGAEGSRAFRAGTTVDQVSSADATAWPLTELMLPAMSTGAVSVVLASDARARRCRRMHGHIVGTGMSTSPYLWDPEWLLDPGRSTQRAARRAYAQAGITSPGDEIDYAEVTALTPALLGPVTEALGLADLPPERLNRSGGARSNFPGFANGALRVIEAVTSLREHKGDGGRPARAVAHASEYLTGTASSNVCVLVLEGT